MANPTDIITDPLPGAPAADTPPPEIDTAQAALDAFDAGSAEVDAAADTPPAPEVAAAASPQADTPAAANAEGESTAQPNEVDTEIAALGLKEKSAERFRELSKRPTLDDVEKQVAPLRERAAKADEWEGFLRESTATPEQLNNALGYIRAINSGDPRVMATAYEAMAKEMAWLGQRLGREVPGSYDPLTEHRDLAEEVDNGQISRQRALEIVAQRTQSTRLGELSQRQEQEQRQHGAAQQAEQRGIAALGMLGNTLKAADPDFARKLPLLEPALAWARDNLPPDKWASYAQQSYAMIALPAAPTPQKPPVGGVPLRPTGAASTQHAEPKDAMEAFDIGLASLAG